MKYLGRPLLGGHDDVRELPCYFSSQETAPLGLPGPKLHEPYSLQPSAKLSLTAADFTNELLTSQPVEMMNNRYIKSASLPRSIGDMLGYTSPGSVKSMRSPYSVPSKRERVETSAAPQHVCPACQYQALSRSKLIVHMRCHSGEKPYACHVCPYRSINRGNLTAHMRTHQGQEPYRCEQCDFRAKFRKELLNHFTLKHRESRSDAPGQQT
ncbi:oocyte zinc finger protein XlCOF28-like [Hyalella azteca]|nr:oocyte zinc finger protein XlCOF28-like [Hyalella azteca]